MPTRGIGWGHSFSVGGCFLALCFTRFDHGRSSPAPAYLSSLGTATCPAACGNVWHTLRRSPGYLQTQSESAAPAGGHRTEVFGGENGRRLRFGKNTILVV